MRTITGLRIGGAAASVAAGTLVALAIIPGNAGAAFDPGFSTACAGDTTITGRGASFQLNAHLAWGADSTLSPVTAAGAKGFGYALAANGGCVSFKTSADGGTNAVHYESLGSGDGRNVVGASTAAVDNTKTPPTGPGQRNTNIQFGAADEPPKPAEIINANNGPDGAAGTADDAVLLTVPVAQSSVAVDVKLPDGCTVPASARKITRLALEGTFAGANGYTTWNTVLPGIVGTGGTTTADCKAKALKRVVRNDSSGTTYAFKNYLRDINATDFPSTGLGNQQWPNNTSSPVNPTVVPTATGGGALLDTLSAQTATGGLGYADLATSRSKGYDSTGDTDSTFWVSVERKDTQYQSPALVDTTSPATPADAGSNCKTVSYKDASTGALPLATQSWYDVTANASVTDYPLCALTYALVWEDPSKANTGRAASANAYTQAQARSIKDYFGYVLNANGGQAALAPAGYQALPTIVSGAAQTGSVLDVAQKAQASLTWNKSAPVDPGTGGGGTTTTTPTTPTTPVTTPTTPVTTPTTPVTTPTTPVKTTPAPAPKPAATTVSVSKAAAVKGKKITLTVSPAGAGKVTVSATTGTGKKKVTVLSGSATAKKAGALKITLKPSSKGKKALKSGKSVKISFKVTFTNADGVKKTTTKSIKVKIKG